MYVWLLKQIIWCIPSMSLLWKKVRQFCFVKYVTWLMVVWLKLCLRIWSEALWLSIFNRQNFRSGFQCFLDNAHSIFVNRQLHMLGLLIGNVSMPWIGPTGIFLIGLYDFHSLTKTMIPLLWVKASRRDMHALQQQLL